MSEGEVTTNTEASEPQQGVSHPQRGENSTLPPQQFINSLPVLPTLPDIAGWGSSSVRETPTTAVDASYPYSDQNIDGQNTGERHYSPEELTENLIHDPQAFFQWLQEKHNPDRVMELSSQGIYGEMPYDYSGVTIEEVAKAVQRVFDAFPDNPVAAKAFLASLSPAQILVDAPFVKDDELIRIAEEAEQAERARLEQFPDVQALQSPIEGVRRYVHTTGNNAIAQQIEEKGLYAAPSGIMHTAKGVSETAEGIMDGFVRRHKGGDTVLIITLPQALRQQYEKALRGKGIDYSALFVQKLPDGQKATGSYGEPIEYVLPSRYILGHLDTVTGTFHTNGTYNPQLSEQEQQTLLEKMNHL